jgi:hypothetical protein
MKTSTVIVIGVVGLAAVGGFVYWQHATRTQAALAQAAKSPTRSSSTTEKIFGTIAAGLPLAEKITELWS